MLNKYLLGLKNNRIRPDPRSAVLFKAVAKGMALFPVAFLTLTPTGQFPSSPGPRVPGIAGEVEERGVRSKADTALKGQHDATSLQHPPVILPAAVDSHPVQGAAPASQ